ncbi:MAG: sulfite exporter TauE/SafE family protein [Flavobacterium sp.]|jgi:sulfite exporter TauE/SafE|uniref:sulfite exporter TauE/SafE family protein n=1 Tax=Flavobacterium sp. TaxID=239 RepID=UPI0022C580A6|nr:sulfite exporter TauE/SafE family protein [Flavobacterium sp.]MCZ8169779.1 sulfite exporter TauE/SafE family protein [Flavobacterium sp.]MCZ8296737.1 sulfite exporter TauE/SafE family protein [Flavobacterium sp.]
MLIAALFLGIISSLHCIGMCGPIALLLPVDRAITSRKALQILLYHLGRLTAYGVLGFVFGLLGRGFYLAGMQQQLSIVVGILMIAIALIPEKVFARYNFSQPVYRAIAAVKSHLGQHFKRKSPDALFTIGLLNGFLPCGMVYAALFGALAMPRLTESVGYMLLYGLGTIPLMSLVVYAQSWITVPVRQRLQQLIPVVAVGIGVLFIVRGMGLGIPYLSPTTTSLWVQAQANCH